jgi:hypothetical protein
MRTKPFPPRAWMVLLALVVGSLIWGAPAFAQEKDQRKGACAADAQKLCPDAKTAKERMQCLQSHETELSQGCKDLRTHMGQLGAKSAEKRAQMRDACKGDAETLCKDVKPGGGAVLQCLKSHETELSTACKDTLPKGKGKTS